MMLRPFTMDEVRAIGAGDFGLAPRPLESDERYRERVASAADRALMGRAPLLVRLLRGDPDAVNTIPADEQAKLRRLAAQVAASVHAALEAGAPVQPVPLFGIAEAAAQRFYRDALIEALGAREASRVQVDLGAGVREPLTREPS